MHYVTCASLLGNCQERLTTSCQPRKMYGEYLIKQLVYAGRSGPSAQQRLYLSLRGWREPSVRFVTCEEVSSPPALALSLPVWRCRLQQNMSETSKRTNPCQAGKMTKLTHVQCRRAVRRRAPPPAKPFNPGTITTLNWPFSCVASALTFALHSLLTFLTGRVPPVS
jgi:hypothetical protein